MCMLADKEEIGSEGVSGMKSAAFDTFMSDLCDTQHLPLKVCYEHSFCLSADVTNAFDPTFADTCDRRNNAKLNYGIGVCKYTGARGKSGAGIFAKANAIVEVCGVALFIDLGEVGVEGGGHIGGQAEGLLVAGLQGGPLAVAQIAHKDIKGR